MISKNLLTRQDCLFSANPKIGLCLLFCWRVILHTIYNKFISFWWKYLLLFKFQTTIRYFKNSTSSSSFRPNMTLSLIVKHKPKATERLQKYESYHSNQLKKQHPNSKFRQDIPSLYVTFRDNNTMNAMYKFQEILAIS